MNTSSDIPPDRWELLYDAATQAVNSEHLKEAERLYQAALKEADRLGRNPPRVVATIESLLDLYEHMNSRSAYPKYKSLARRLLQIKEQVFGIDSLELDSALDRLARAYLACGQSLQAERVYRHLLRLEEDILGPNDPAVASTLQDLALALEGTDRQNEAENLWARALSIIENAEGPHSLKLVGVLENLAKVLVAEGKHREAIEALERAISLVSNLDDWGHIPVHLIEQLAKSHVAIGDYQGAKPLYQRSLAMEDNLWSRKRAEIAEVGIGPLERTRVFRDQYEYLSTLLGQYGAVLRQLGEEIEAARLEARSTDLAADATALTSLLDEVAKIATGKAIPTN